VDQSFRPEAAITGKEGGEGAHTAGGDKPHCFQSKLSRSQKWANRIVSKKKKVQEKSRPLPSRQPNVFIETGVKNPRTQELRGL